MAAKRFRSELPSGSGDAAGYVSARASSASAALAVGDEISMEERVTDLEAAVDRIAYLQANLGAQQAYTARQATQLRLDVDGVLSWTRWLQRCYHWINNCARSFPWD